MNISIYEHTYMYIHIYMTMTAAVQVNRHGGADGAASAAIR